MNKFKCSVCKQDRQINDRTDEHPLPESLIGDNDTLVYDLCKKCNGKFSKYDGVACDYYSVISQLYGVKKNKAGKTKVAQMRVCEAKHLHQKKMTGKDWIDYLRFIYKVTVGIQEGRPDKLAQDILVKGKLHFNVYVECHHELIGIDEKDNFAHLANFSLNVKDLETGEEKIDNIEVFRVLNTIFYVNTTSLTSRFIPEPNANKGECMHFKPKGVSGGVLVCSQDVKSSHRYAHGTSFFTKYVGGKEVKYNEVMMSREEMLNAGLGEKISVPDFQERTFG